MKLSLLILGAAVADDNKDRTIGPLVRLDNLYSGITDWCYTWIPNDNRKTRISTNLNDLITRMVGQFDLECALQTPPNNEAAGMDEVFIN